jgi:hypothetical protein
LTMTWLAMFGASLPISARYRCEPETGDRRKKVKRGELSGVGLDKSERVLQSAGKNKKKS